MEKEEVAQIEILNVEDDEVLFRPLLEKGTTKKTAIPVEQYNEERDLELAIMASLSPSKPTKKQNFIHLDDCDYDDDLHVLNFVPENTPLGKNKRSFSNLSVTETGQSSNSKVKYEDKNDGPSYNCEICVEPMSKSESFRIKGCSHVYCENCMRKYVASKLQENVSSISCPVADCKGVLEPEYCRNILPEDVFIRWGNALCEALILGSQKFYCPFKDCSALLIDEGGEVIRESECPNCRRLFCAQCRVPWHAGINCEDFQRLNKDEREKEDIMLMNLAKNKNWKRCPNCKYYVEKKHGCMYLKCRCGSAFCYNCGTPSDNNFERYHNCTRCRQ